MKTQIGTAIVSFDQSGNINSVQYNSNMTAMLSRLELEVSLSDMHATSEEAILEASQIAMAKWFNKVNEVELFDRTESALETVIDKCIKVNGQITECHIDFFITPLN